MEHTTNEQKAKEIQSKDPCQVWIGGCPNVYAAAIEMAKFKDKQFTELINALPTPLKELIKAFANYSESNPHPPCPCILYTPKQR